MSGLFKSFYLGHFTVCLSDFTGPHRFVLKVGYLLERKLGITISVPVKTFLDISCIVFISGSSLWSFGIFLFRHFQPSYTNLLTLSW